MRDELLSFYLYKQAMELKNVYRALFFIFLYSTCTAQTQGKYVIIAWIYLSLGIYLTVSVFRTYLSLYLQGAPQGFLFPIAYGWLSRLYCEIRSRHSDKRFPHLIEFYFLRFPFQLFYCSLMAQIEACIRYNRGRVDTQLYLRRLSKFILFSTTTYLI